MSGITVRVDPRAVLGWLSDAEQRQLPFAVSLALNRVANVAQQAEREQIKKVFKLRRESFVLRGVKIEKQDRASKSSWRVIIQIAYPDERTFLNQHEVGGYRTRFEGKRLWKPNPDVFQSKVIGRANPLHPKNLKLHKDKGGRIVGEQRTFLVRSKGKVLILQRGDRRLTKASARRLGGLTLDNVATGMGPRMRKQKAITRTDGTRLLYMLVQRTRIPARLQFVGTIGGVAQAAFPEALRLALADALRPR
jgi:hypothetical protein